MAADPTRGRLVTLFSGFKKFLMRGNVVDLAVAVVMGAAFGAIVKSLVSDIIMPLITAIFGKQDYTKLTFTINKSSFAYGDLLTNVISFVSIAAAVYFLIVMPLNHLNDRRKARLGIPEQATATEKELLAEIRDLLASQRNSN
ncbi:large conductance mechanosensitive channel protein MscL [Catenulispora pinisilvae]|uniref:large conductance mechanosensitive channel protein MscL n=1 Tax=Catenulispora pinisilvae TaxID=2705253 RepID=UPI002B26C2D4|nr:large conductance mechanosensitive channel protein MscL [Catenulispora pinisilvae]